MSKTRVETVLMLNTGDETIAATVRLELDDKGWVWAYRSRGEWAGTWHRLDVRVVRAPHSPQAPIVELSAES